MAKLDLRVRLLGWALRRASIAKMSGEQIARAQRRTVGHNPIIALLLGGVAPGVTLSKCLSVN